MPNEKLAGLLLKKDSDQTSDNSDSQPLAPPAPPPMQPITAQNNPYEFITNPTTPTKKRLFPGGNSLISRLIVISLGVVILFIIGLVAFSLFNSDSTSLKNDYSDLVQQQAELIRVSDIGIQKSRQSTAKNLAITSKLSLTSQQPGLLALAKKARAITDPKKIAAGADPKTDSALTSADQSNNFDEEFIKLMSANLAKYQKSLKNVYNASTNTKSKDTLSKNYNAISVLIGKNEESK